MMPILSLKLCGSYEKASCISGCGYIYICVFISELMMVARKLLKKNGFSCKFVKRRKKKNSLLEVYSC